MREVPLADRIASALAAGDRAGAVTLLHEACKETFAGHLPLRLDRLGQWLDALRAEAEADPWLLYYRARIWTAERRQALAAVALGRAERLFRRQPASPEREQAIALTKLAQGVVAERDGDFGRAREAFAAARVLLPQLSEREQWIGADDAERWRARDPSGAAAFYLEAIPALRGAGEPMPLARMLHNFALELLRRGEPGSARHAALRAVELKRGLDTDAGLANSLNVLGMAERQMGMADAARKTLGESIVLAERGGHALLHAYALNNLAEVERDAGDGARAAELYELSLQGKEASGDEYGLAYGLRSRAALARRSRDYALARQLIERALQLREPVADAYESALLELEAGLVLAGSGDADGARAHLEHVRFLADETDAKLQSILARLALAALTGAPDDAQEPLAAAARYRLTAVLRPEFEWLRTVDPSFAPGAVSTTRGARAWLLDGSRLELAGRPVDFARWRSKRAAELVRILVAHRGRGVSRDSLVEWLWPDRADASANLHVAVNSARHELAAVAPGDWIAREGDMYRLDMLEWADADELAARYNAARRAIASNDTVSARRELRIASDLALAEPLGVDRYAEWAAPERARLGELVQIVTERLGAIELELGNGDDAVLLARRAISAEPSRETAHQLLIRAHMSRGDHASALRALEDCRQALSRELGVAPSHETEALVRS